MVIDTEKGKYQSPIGSKTWEYIAISTCSIMAGCIGFVVGWNSPSIVILMGKNSPISVTASEISTLVVTMSVGQMLSPTINRFIVDKLGRKNTIVLSALPLLISWSLIAIATSIWALYVARFLAGIALGLFTCVCPIYIGEVSSPDTRGIANSLAVVSYNIGILVTFIVAPHMSLSSMATIFLVINIGFVIIFWFMPESPYFLVMKSRIDDAEEVLEKLRGRTNVSEDLRIIFDSLPNGSGELVKNGNLRALLMRRANFRAFLVIMLFTVTHHFGGYFTILVYGQLIFQSINNVMSDYVINVAIGITQVVSVLLTTLLADKLGRKPLILASGVIAAICNFIISIFFYARDHTYADMLPYSWVLFVSSLILIFTFNCGLVCLQIILISEMFATEIKAVGTSVVSVIGGLLGILGGKIYMWIAINLNYGHSFPFFLFFIIVAICTAAIYHITPETKGKTFAEIQRKLNK